MNSFNEFQMYLDIPNKISQEIETISIHLGYIISMLNLDDYKDFVKHVITIASTITFLFPYSCGETNQRVEQFRCIIIWSDFRPHIISKRLTHSATCKGSNFESKTSNVITSTDHSIHHLIMYHIRNINTFTSELTFNYNKNSKSKMQPFFIITVILLENYSKTMSALQI